MNFNNHPHLYPVSQSMYYWIDSGKMTFSMGWNHINNHPYNHVRQIVVGSPNSPQRLQILEGMNHLSRYKLPEGDKWFWPHSNDSFNFEI